MGRMVDLERVKVERLAVELMPDLREQGQLFARTGELESVDRWRRAARRAGRLLGWRVRTGITHDGAKVWAVSDDYPVSEGEVRRATNRLSWLLRGG